MVVRMVKSYPKDEIYTYKPLIILRNVDSEGIILTPIKKNRIFRSRQASKEYLTIKNKEHIY